MHKFFHDEICYDLIRVSVRKNISGIASDDGRLLIEIESRNYNRAWGRKQTFVLSMVATQKQVLAGF